ncbi:MAG: diaminopimelate decarboxylase [Fervidobacterium sp.]|uniref:diaminopimelate decarboxylase n=1 Tax=Fervidobacterium sp. TaxID=1871331 RepID=UPI00404A6A12
MEILERTEMKELISKLGKTYGTPLYVYFEEVIRERARLVKSVFEGINLLPTFACKSNNNPNLIKILYEEGFGTDIVTVGEYYASKMADVPDEMIVWNGNGKSIEDMNELSNVRYVNIDSFEEYEHWMAFKRQYGSVPDFFLRVNPNVDAKTHPHISTGLKKNKFGINIDYVSKILEKSNHNITGLHTHIGSQITSVEPFEEAISQVVELSRKYNLRKINIGGGWGINYNGSELDIVEYKNRIIPLLKDFEEVIIEIGRYIIAPAGILLLQVEYVKRTQEKTFVVVNGGMNTLLRPALYDAFHKIMVLNPTSEKNVVDVVGPLCESGDVIAVQREIEIPEVGSLLLVENAGAYGYSMSNNYNSTLKPAEVLITQKGEAKLIRRRETYSDLFRTII